MPEFMTETWFLGLLCVGAVVLCVLVLILFIIWRVSRSNSYVEPLPSYNTVPPETTESRPKLRYACPRCQASLESPEQFAGSNVLCPICKGTLTVPHHSVNPPLAVPVSAQVNQSGGSHIRFSC